MHHPENEEQSNDCKTEHQAIELTEQANGKILEVKATGTLTRDDYSALLPRLEKMINQHGKIRVLFYMIDFRGWTPGAMWEDLKFDAQHFTKIDRLALVGNSLWEQAMATFCKPFAAAAIRYFDKSELPAARQWLEEE